MLFNFPHSKRLVLYSPVFRLLLWPLFLHTNCHFHITFLYNTYSFHISIVYFLLRLFCYSSLWALGSIIVLTKKLIYVLMRSTTWAFRYVYYLVLRKVVMTVNTGTCSLLYLTHILYQLISMSIFWYEIQIWYNKT